MDVTLILSSLEIPAQLPNLNSLGLPNKNPEDSDEWKELWITKWESSFPQLGGAVALNDINKAVLQADADGKVLGWVFLGVPELVFADLRGSLEDAGKEPDTYRNFEVWSDDIALLEDEGALIIGSFTQNLLRSLDTGEGLMDTADELKLAFDRAGEGWLAANGSTSCNGSFFSASLNGCDAIVEAVRSGNATNTGVSGTYVFSSESRAESGLDDVVEAIENQDIYDADLNEIEAAGESVTYNVAIIGGFVARGGTGEGENPLHPERSSFRLNSECWQHHGAGI